MKSLNIYEVKEQFPELLGTVESGEEIILEKSGESRQSSESKFRQKALDWLPGGGHHAEIYFYLNHRKIILPGTFLAP